MKTTLYLARHGQTQWNVEQRFQGLLDSDLTATGEQQSKALALSMIDKQLDIIASSTLGRAMKTANICSQIVCKPIVNVAGLIERDLGLWQAQLVHNVKTDEHYNEILHQFTALTAHNVESAVICGLRIHDALKSLALTNTNKNILVIVHGEALRCFLAHLGHLSTDNAYELFDNASVSHFTFYSDTNHFQFHPESKSA